MGDIPQDLERVVTIVDKLHALIPRSQRQSEQVAPAACRIDLARVDLMAKWGRLDDVFVSTVHAEHVAVGGQSQTEGSIE